MRAMVTASRPSRAVSTTQPQRPSELWAARRTRSSLSATRTRRPLNGGGGAGQVEGFGAGVGAEVTAAGGGDVAGDPVALGQGAQLAAGGVGDHAVLQEDLEPAGGRVEQADLEELVAEQVAGEPADVAL